MSSEESASGSCTPRDADRPAQGGKIEVLMCAVSDAPIMKQRKWAVEGHRTVADVVHTARRYLKVDDGRALFVYVAQCFAPPLDATVHTLSTCYGADGKLTLHYCLTHAWG